MFIGADHEVTGSCHYVEACGKRFIVDYGMEQGLNVYENVDLPVNAGNLDFILLTHAHIDHSGLIPLLYAKGFRGKIYATRATTDLCEIMLQDSARWMMRSMSCSISCHAHMADRLKLLTALRSNLQISDIC